MPLFVATVYCHPARMRPARGEDGQELPVGEDGRRKMEREPGSRTRPARAWEMAEAWWEPAPEGFGPGCAFIAEDLGVIVREA
jgi:hypothetical protein